VTRIAFPFLHFLNLVFSIRGFVMNCVTKFLSVLGLTVVLSTNAVAAVVLVTNNGILTGANGVDVGGILYDVTFGDGILANSITSFTNLSSAQQASAALDTVFRGIYDESPQLTNGCYSPIICSIETPFDFTIQGTTSVAWGNFASFLPIADGLGNAVSFEPPTDTEYIAAQTIATWRLSTPITAVPEPETYAMFLAGLGLLGFVARRRKQKAAV